MTAINAILLLIGIAVWVIFIYGIVIPKIQEWKDMKETIKRYGKTYLSKSGGTSLYFPPTWNKIRDGKNFNYYLESFDSGKNWYAIDKDKLFDEVLVLGLVDHVYPGLMDHLEEFDNLTKRVTEKGGLDITDSSDVKVLTDAGFIVSQK